MIIFQWKMIASFLGTQAFRCTSGQVWGIGSVSQVCPQTATDNCLAKCSEL